MKIEHDSLFLIGKSHQVCQDYALSGITPDGIPYAIVADGCSGSAHSDVGARLLAHAAVANLPGLITPGGGSSVATQYEEFGLAAVDAASLALQQLGLDSTPTLDATLLVGVVYQEVVWVFMYGDGCILVNRKDDSADVIDSSFVNNAPYYLNYLLDDERHEAFEQQSGEFGKTQIFNGAETLYPFTFPSIYYWPVSMINSVILSTDGASSFVNDHTREPILLDEVASEVLALKNTHGEFLKRRVRRFTTDWAKKGISHYDDLGMAGFAFKQDEEE